MRPSDTFLTAERQGQIQQIYSSSSFKLKDKH
jgi:hypothetical protein